MIEIFKEITFDDTDFVVGNHGTIYRNGKLATLTETPDGYLQVACKKRSIGVHRLVAMCFVAGRTDERNEVNHKNFDRKKNVASNLEWMTHAENIQYSAEHGLPKDICGEKNPNWGNTKLSTFYAAHPEISKEKQGRPGARNGKAVQVDVYKDGIFVGHFDYLGACHEYMCTEYGWDCDAETFRCGLRRSAKYGRSYKGFTFIKQ